MKACMELGVPHSIFIGRPWPQPGEALWLPGDRVKVLGYQRWESDLCRSCGQHRTAWHDHEGMALVDPPFLPVAIMCPSCEVLGTYEDEHRAQRGEREARRGLIWAWRPADEVDDSASDAGEGDERTLI